MPLNNALPKFLSEILKKNDQEYLGKTLYEMLICIQFHLETLGYYYKLLDDDRFADVKYTLDNIMKDRASKGIVRPRRKSDVLSAFDEDVLWETGVVGLTTSQQIQNLVFLIIGMGCAMRAGKEHHE